MSVHHLPSRVLIVGGGIIGLATAWQLLRRGVGVHLLEKEERVGIHQSTRNSGVLHAGLYYKPGSLKAQLAVRGIRLMSSFCQEHNIPYEICGKLVVATSESEVPRLMELLERGRRNGLRNLRLLDSSAIREIEPHVAGVSAVHVPEEGIVDYRGVCDVLAHEIVHEGGVITTGAAVRSLVWNASEWRAESSSGSWAAPFVVNCAGLHCDRVHRMAGGNSTARIIPFRGEYHRLRKEREFLVRHLIYPVPDPAFPFLGVHFTRMIGGGVEAGPNAVLALAREGYRMRDINAIDLAESLAFPGLWRFLLQYPQMCSHELLLSLSKRCFCQALQRLIPEIQITDLTAGGAGVRAQAIDRDGTLLQDFRFAHGKNALHLLNAPSPGATASLAIGEAVVQEIETHF